MPPLVVDLAATARARAGVGGGGAGGAAGSRRPRHAGHPGAVPDRAAHPGASSVRSRREAKPRTQVLLETDAVPHVPYFSWFMGPILRSAQQAGPGLGRAGAAGGRSRRSPLPRRRSGRRWRLRRRSPLRRRSRWRRCAPSPPRSPSAAALLSQNAGYVAQSFGASDTALGHGAARLPRRRAHRPRGLGDGRPQGPADAPAPLPRRRRSRQRRRRPRAQPGGVHRHPDGDAGLRQRRPDRGRHRRGGGSARGSAGLLGGAPRPGGRVRLRLRRHAPTAGRSRIRKRGVSPSLRRRRPCCSCPASPGAWRRRRRYAGLAARHAPRGRAGEVFDRSYGGRFWVLVVSGFLFAIFAAPSSQLTNDYLKDIRGFSGLDITIFRAITQGFPGLAGIAIGGRLAETRGRRPVAAIALVHRHGRPDDLLPLRRRHPVALVSGGDRPRRDRRSGARGVQRGDVPHRDPGHGQRLPGRGRRHRRSRRPVVHRASVRPVRARRGHRPDRHRLSGGVAAGPSPARRRPTARSTRSARRKCEADAFRPRRRGRRGRNGLVGWKET